MAQERTNRGFYKKYFREIDVVHGLQTKPEDRDWLLSTPEDDVKQSDIVLYLGCNVLRTTHMIRTVTDIFKLMGVSYAAVGGKTYCCGIQHFQRGDEDAGRSVAATTAANFQKFNPKQVVMWCPSCIYFYDDIMDMRGKSFDFNHVTQFLVDNLDKLDFQPQPETTVALHYHTGRSQSDAEAQSAITLLSKLLGVTVVDIGTDERFGRHCTPAVREKIGPEAWETMATGFVEKAIGQGVDTFTTLYYHPLPRVSAAHVPLRSRLPGEGGTLPDPSGPGIGHRARRPAQEARSLRRCRCHLGRDQPLCRGQRNPPRGSSPSNRKELRGAVTGRLFYSLMPLASRSLDKPTTSFCFTPSRPSRSMPGRRTKFRIAVGHAYFP
jgi:hypothetical protein